MILHMEIAAGSAIQSSLPAGYVSVGETLMKKLILQNGQPLDEAAVGFAKQYWPASLLQRFSIVEEVASMVVHVVSREVPATNGAAPRRLNVSAL